MKMNKVIPPTAVNERLADISKRLVFADEITTLEVVLLLIAQNVSDTVHFRLKNDGGIFHAGFDVFDYEARTITSCTNCSISLVEAVFGAVERLKAEMD